MMTTSAPLVSICIPVYSGMPYVLETIESCIKQSYSNMEIIVCDHGSKDESVPAIIEHIKKAQDKRVKLEVRPDMGTMVRNWNDTVSLARGEYVKLLPSDDLLYEHCIKSEISALETHRDCAGTFSTKMIITSTGSPVTAKRIIKAGLIDWGQIGGRLLRSYSNPLGEPGAALIRRSAGDSLGWFREGLFYFADMDLWFRLLQQAPFWGIPEPGCKYRIHSAALTAKSFWQSINEFNDFVNMHRSKVPNDKRLHPNYLYAKAFVNALARYILSRAVYLAMRS